MNSKGQFTYCNVLTVGEASEKESENILFSHNSSIQIFECPSLFANMNLQKDSVHSECLEYLEYFVWVLQIHQCQLLSSIAGILAFHVTSANAFQMIWKLKLKIP